VDLVQALLVEHGLIGHSVSHTVSNGTIIAGTEKWKEREEPGRHFTDNILLRLTERH
jgi:hypothetical protein